MILICILKIQTNLDLRKQIANLIITSMVNKIYVYVGVCQRYQNKITECTRLKA